MITKTHLFFFLTSSPAPLLSSFCSFNLLFSLVLFFKFSHNPSFVLSLILITCVSLSWWFIYRDEFFKEGKGSFRVERGLKLSMVLFISSEVFFFFSFFWSYFHFFLSPSLEIGLSFPPEAVEMFDFLNVPLINTLVLLTSGLTLTMRHFYVVKGEKLLSSFLLGLTCLLGILFTLLQVAEYNRSFFTLRDRTFGTTFFILTGFHGIHVLIGTIFLFIILIRSQFLFNTSSSPLGFELASWYWHFVDVVWIFLYFCIYYLNR